MSAVAQEEAVEKYTEFADDGTPISPKTGKKIWGAPLKIWQLEREVAAVKAVSVAADAHGGLSHCAMRDMWPVPEGQEKSQKSGHQFYAELTVPDNGEFTYKETMDFATDSGYDVQTLFDRITKMAGRSIGDQKTDAGLARRTRRCGPPRIEKGKHIAPHDYSTLPEFRTGNRIEVTVKIIGSDA